jgi:antitoxin (DNA-binding transcriptional repressor) of toxin-antitoxin stability system
MKTITITQARKNLSGWITRASSGEEIGIINGDQIVSLKPIQVTELNYAEAEYGLTPADMETIGANIKAESKRMVATGDFVTLESLENAPHNPVKKRSQRN